MSEKSENMYIEHFNRELEIMRATVKGNDDLVIEPYVRSIREVCKDFADEGHSGGSAPMAASILAQTIKAVLGFQILSPLTGQDAEWNDVSDMGGANPIGSRILFQNKRDSAVFKNSEDKCTYNTCIVWKGEEPYDTFTGSLAGIGSSHYIKSFPFMPKTFYVDVYRELYDENNPKHKGADVISCGPGDMAYFIKDPKQLEEVFNYYDKREINLKSNNKEEDDTKESTSASSTEDEKTVQEAPRSEGSSPVSDN